MNAWEAVSQFGRVLGVSDLSLDGAREAHLGLDSGDTISFTLTDEVLLLHLRRPFPHPSSDVLLRALQRCQARNSGALRLQMGGRGQGADFALIAATRFRADSVTPEELGRACDGLLESMRTVTGASR